MKSPYDVTNVTKGGCQALSGIPPAALDSDNMIISRER